MAMGVTDPALRRAGRASDPTLVAATRAGNDEAFLVLYDRYRDLAWRVARGVTSNDVDAEDAVAEAFARLYGAIPRLEIDAFRSYLAATVRNAATDIVRSREQPDSDTVGDETPEIPSSGVDETALDWSERELVSGAFESLPERMRTALWLREVEGFSTRELADVLGVTPNTAAAVVMRAREQLRIAYLREHLGRPAEAACAAIAAEIGAYVRGSASSRSQRRARAHLERCPTCADRLNEVQDVNRALPAVLPAAPPGISSAAELLEHV